MKPILALLALAALAITSPPALQADAQTRIRDVVDVEGVRQNDLIGYGIVVGLNGTGDSVRNSPFTEDSLTYMLERLGVNVQGEDIKPDNVAAVLVTATLPSFARNGSTLDISVASIGDAESLEGGTLVLTPLKGADNEVYAVAQGSIVVSGIDVKADGARARRGTPTQGAIPNGARVEREIPYQFNDRNSLVLALREPDFTTAARIEDTINAAIGSPVAYTRDPGTVDIDLRSLQGSPSRVLASIENLPIEVAVPARIVIDEQSGTIVLGKDVTISRVAIAQGDISIKVTETPVVSQPNPFADGESIVLPRSQIEIGQTGTRNIATLDANVTLSQLIAGLNALGVSPQEMGDIIRTMKAAGALHADLIVQ
ncbi:flagellar basal body P-ring protein FlgI [Henriciella algicola]|jgi:flagellar P-ring protein FlgI|uniref:Flagellar P-ring protein n=1 Tax=Henriciella algicola TaxID=1608422 RepID=A0A399RBL5_9PROT|nr:flagellar basal body P-ring protein FlgI [Henriciella algicola]RIJ27315.1 flagellar basal body P-ring protein FlgI [Henriciella algicola]